MRRDEERLQRLVVQYCRIAAAYGFSPADGFIRGEKPPFVVSGWVPWMLGRIYAVPNGMYTLPQVAANHKAMGLLSGVPDLCLPYPTDEYHGLYIELKSGASGKESKNQLDYIDYLNSVGYNAVVCRDEHSFIRVIKDYLRWVDS